MLPTHADLDGAAAVVYGVMPPTPQYRWPLLCERAGLDLCVKHENHTPLGAFKVRGGLVYFDWLSRTSKVRGVISATRGNHGQSVAFAARRTGMPVRIVVPHGNSLEKNAAMRALGAELIEHGDDFQDARELAESMAQGQGLHMVPSFHEKLVAGVGTYAMEFLGAQPDLDVVYVSIGMGSGFCGMAAAREALGLRCDIVGVVSSHARAYAESFARHECVSMPVGTRLADGMAVRAPSPEALDIMRRHAARIVEVSDAEVAAAMAMLFECTHNVAEGAGAAGLAAALQERDANAGRRVGIVLSGGNVDRDVFAGILRPAKRAGAD